MNLKFYISNKLTTFMSKKIIFNLLMVYSIKQSLCGYIFNSNPDSLIDNFDSFTELLTKDDKKRKDKGLTKKMRETIIESFTKLQPGCFVDVGLPCNFQLDKFDGTKKYISEITEKANFVFNSFSEITNDGVDKVTNKNFIVIKGKKNDTTIIITLFKNITENKKIDKDGELKDNIKKS